MNVFSFFKICKLISQNKFEVLLLGCIIFIILTAGYHFITGKRKQGKWSTTVFNPFLSSSHNAFALADERPRNKESSGEIECRRVLQKLLKRNFDKIRPNFLNNSVTGGKHNLEIDCYNEELRLGVEYQGQQHYKFIPFFHKNYEAFMNQKYRDELKRMLLKQNNIVLIEVPYTVKTIDIEDFLKTKLRKYGYL